MLFKKKTIYNFFPSQKLFNYGNCWSLTIIEVHLNLLKFIAGKNEVAKSSFILRK